MRYGGPRFVFLAVLALFLLPLVLAVLMHTGAVGFKPADTDNLGRLVVPPQPLDWNAVSRDTPGDATPGLAGAWVVLFPLPEFCGDDCRERVHSLRQVQRAAGRQAERIRVAVLSRALPAGELPSQLRAIHPQLYLLYGPQPAFNAALHRAAAGGREPSVYLVDPLGNIMMTYDASDSMNKLRKDLKKLLTWSKLGEQT